MSYQPSRWAIGLVPLTVLWILGSTGAERDIERALSRGVGAAVEGDVETPKVEAAGRDVALGGEAFTHADMKAAIDKANASPGVR